MWKTLATLALMTQVATADSKEGSCDAKKFAPAKKLDAYKMPAGCAAGPKAQQQAGLAVTKEADARTHLICKDPSTKLGVDFTKRQLIVTSRSFSPAQIGLDVYDDGKKITFVSRQRSPCKNDPRPMPGPNVTFLFEAPAGARTFSDGSCTVETKCP